MMQYPARFTVILLSFLLVALGLTAFYWPFLSNAASFFIFDFTYGWHSNIEYFGGQLRAGKLPLWNPFVLCGISQLAIATPSFFHISDLIFGMLPFNPAMAATLLANQLLAAIGAFLLAVSFGAHPMAALFGAVTYGLCGTMFSAQVAYTYQQSAALIPWCLWAVREIGNPRRNAYALGALLALLVGMIVSAGIVELMVPTIVALFVYVVFAFFSSRLAATATAARTSRPAATATVSKLGIIAGILLAAPVWLPVAQWVPLSPRAAGLPLREILYYSATWYDFALLVLLQPFGDLYNSSNIFERLPLASTAPLLATAFLGPIVFTLAVRALTVLSPKQRTFVYASLFLTSIAALGGNTILGAAFVRAFHSPVRYPLKLIYFVALIVVVLSVTGAHALIERRGAAANKVSIAIWLVTAAIGAALLSSMGAAEFASFVSPADPKLGLAAAQPLANSLFLASGLGLVAVLLSWLCDRGRIRALLSVLLLTLLAGGTFLVAAFAFQRHAGAADFFSRPSSLAQEIQKQPIPQAASYIRFAAMYQDPAKVMAADELRDWTMANYQHVRQMLVLPNNVDYGIGAVVGRTPGELNPVYRAFVHARQGWAHNDDRAFEKYCQITGAPLAVTQARNVSYNQVIGSVPLLDATRFQQIAQDDGNNFRVYRLVHPVYRAFFAPSVAWGAPHQAVVNAIAQADVSGFDPTKLTILEHAFSGEKGPQLSVTQQQLFSSEIEFMADQADFVQIAAATPVDNFLVLLDQNYPGWRAYVDGKAVQIYLANGNFRAVFLPAGRHVVTFEFVPKILWVALALAAAGALLVIAIALPALRRRRKW